MLRFALVAAVFFGAGLGAACTTDPLANVCSTPTVCGSDLAGFRLCTREGGSEAIILACDDRTHCSSEADVGQNGEVFACVSPSDCTAARRDAIDWCAKRE